MNKLTKVLLVIAITIVALILIWGFVLNRYAHHECKTECLERGTFAYELYHSGNYAIDDMCVCFFEGNKFESFRLGK